MILDYAKVINLFSDNKLFNILPEKFIRYKDTFSFAVRNNKPRLQFEIISEFLQELNDNDLKIIADYWQITELHKKTIQKPKKFITKEESFNLSSTISIDSDLNNFCLTRNKNSLTIQFWR